MAKWDDLADWRGPTPNQSGPMVEQRGVVLHIAEGYYEGTISWQKNPAADVSSHFICGKEPGETAQMVDTGTTAWTQRAGNGHWLSIENAGFVPDKLTDHQVEFAAQILARAHTEYGVPLQVATSPEGRGLGHHSMGADPGSPDDWGHSQCPGSNIINQKNAIVARAKEIVEGDDMPTGIIGLRKGDQSTEVTGLKNLLRRIGTLDEDNNSSTYDAATVQAVFDTRKMMGSSITELVDAERITGDAYAQIMSALALTYAKEHAGQDGEPGPPGAQGEPGPAGTLPPGTVLELSGGSATVAAVQPPTA